MNTKNIAVVTGGAGFIGSHMVDLLRQQGYGVRVIDNLVTGRLENLGHLHADPEVVVDTRDLCALAPDDTLFKDAAYVFHFAGIGDIVPSIEQPARYMAANVQGTVHALECARHWGRLQKFIYAASSSCYGLARQIPTTETATIDTQYPYALSKFQGEQAVLHWGQVYRLPVNSIRMFNVYGTRSRTTGVYGAVFGVFLRQKLAGTPFTVVGDGSQRRDFVYVSDVVRAFYQSAQSSYTGQVYNLGAGNPQSINTLVELLGGEKIYIPKRPGEPECTWADITKIKAHLGWAPEISISEGVRTMLAQIEYWKNAPLWDVATIADATKTWFTSLG
jgi:UDP-glucose 4-epimerase